MPFGITSFTRAGLVAFKRAVRDQSPQLKSAHVDEALAYAFGFETYAAMLPVLELADRSGYLSAAANPDWFVVRLVQLGYDLQSVRSLRQYVWGYQYQHLENGRTQERDALANALLAPRPANDG